MKISEMEDHHGRYVALESSITTALNSGDFGSVFSACEESFPHIVPAINFRKKRGIEPETPSLLALSIVWDYAPPLFENAVLESAFDFVKSTRLLAKHENGYLHCAEAALEREHTAQILWNHLEHHPGSLQRDAVTELGLSSADVLGILGKWEELGVILRMENGDSSRLHFRSPLDAVAEGICQACGVRGKGRKELFFKSITCKRCGTEGYYHVVYSDQQ